MERRHKYYKTIIEVEILSNDTFIDEIDNASLSELGEMITDGYHSGVQKIVARKVLSERQMAKALISQGSDPEFLIPKYNNDEDR